MIDEVHMQLAELMRKNQGTFLVGNVGTREPFTLGRIMQQDTVVQICSSLQAYFWTKLLGEVSCYSCTPSPLNQIECNV